MKTIYKPACLHYVFFSFFRFWKRLIQNDHIWLELREQEEQLIRRCDFGDPVTDLYAIESEHICLNSRLRKTEDPRIGRLLRKLFGALKFKEYTNYFAHNNNCSGYIF